MPMECSKTKACKSASKAGLGAPPKYRKIRLKECFPTTFSLERNTMAKIIEMKIGVVDRILIDDAIEGIVAFSTISDDYSEDYPRENYQGPENDGILIIQDNGARIFHDTDYLLSEYCRVEILKKGEGNT